MKGFFMDTEVISKFIDPSLLILIPTLWGIGMAIKKSNVKNCFIPVILLIASCFFSGLYLYTTKIILDYQDYMSWIFSFITQGCLIWLAAWKTYLMFLEEKSGKNETS